MTLLLKTIASSLVIAASQYSIAMAMETSPKREIESQVSETCSRLVRAELSGDSRRRITSIELHPRNAPAPGERRVGFAVVLKTRDDVPSRYSGFCTITPDRPPAVRVREAESFGRF